MGKFRDKASVWIENISLGKSDRKMETESCSKVGWTLCGRFQIARGREDGKGLFGYLAAGSPQSIFWSRLCLSLNQPIAAGRNGGLRQ
jgi:hypothetical protein